MSAFGGMILTNRGRNLQAKGLTGTQIQFTRIGVGDGSLVGSLIVELNALKNQVKSLPISNLKTTSNGKVTIGAVLSNQDITSGFYFREIGLFAQDPDVGEILYCYANAGTTAEYITAAGGTEVIEKSIDVIAVIGNAQNVSAVIDQSLVYATQTYVNDASNKNKQYADRVFESTSVKEAIFSGMSKLSTLDYTYMKTNPNKIKLVGGGTVYVNGWKIDIPDGTIITLPDPPVSGEREDLIFLEVWKDQVTDSEWEKVSSRIRTVAGVDFKTYETGDGFSALSLGRNTAVLAQGGNDQPLTNTAYAFNRADLLLASNKDVGMYVTGTGSAADKTALKTADGYVYAIPLFRIKRRNSGGHNVSNPNGAYNQLACTGGTLHNATAGTTGTMLFAAGGVTGKFNVGDIVYRNNDRTQGYWTVTSVDSDTQITAKVDSSNRSITGSLFASRTMLRHDWVFADIIDDRDITDLRRLVSLTGFDYQYLVEDSLEKLQRGELQTKERKRMIKTYHGIPKTTTDANTVFYASLDGTTVAEIGGVLNPTGTINYVPMPTGLGFRSSASNIFTVNVNNQSFCWDIIISKADFIAQVSGNLLTLGSATSCTRIRKSTAGDLHIYISSDLGTTVIYAKTLAMSAIQGNFIKVRINYQNGTAECFVNGVSLGAMSGLSLINDTYTSITIVANLAIADLAVSNISRGSVDSTLPADVVAGYAKIDKAFNGQRKNYSDALTSQYTVAIAKAAGNGHSKGVTVTQATPGQWINGDTIKIKGLAGSVISGVVDSDTILARVVSGAGTATLTLDSVTGIAVNDEFKDLDVNFQLLGTVIVQSVDATNKTVTLNRVSSAAYLVETTASTSSPVVKFTNAGTMTVVSGTWSGLGTNEATFTLSANAALTNQDIQIEYSLNNPAGQGIPDVYITTLAGEAKGKKLVVGTIAVTDDFVGKTAGDTLPMAARWAKAASVQAPSAVVTEVTNSDYTNMATLDSANVYTVSTSVNGEIAQVVIRVDVIKEIETKYGPIPSVDKVGWAKANLGHLGGSVHASGSGPNGAKCNASLYRVDTAAWSNTNSHTNVGITLISLGSSSPQNFIDNSGYAYIGVSTDASNGSIASSITIDYVSIALQLKGITGYDMLVPENPRRDDGLTNVLLVRKETKEVQVYFDALPTDGIITYGDVIPYQGLGAAISGTALGTPVALLTTDGTGGPRSLTTALVYPVPITTQLPMVSPDYLPRGEALSGLGSYADYAQTRTRAIPMHTPASTSYKFPTAGVAIGTSSTSSPSGIRGHRQGQSRFYCQIPKQDLPTSPTQHVIVLANVFVNNGEIYLAVAVSAAGGKHTACDGGTTAACDVFRLPNRPLLKGV